MRRPQERHPKTIDALAVLLGISVIVYTAIPGEAAALGLSTLWMLMFAFQRFTGAGRGANTGFDGLAIPAALFALAGAALALGATPFAPGGGHPLWLLLGHGGGAALDLQSEWIGALEMTGLSAAFLVAAAIGARPQIARSLTDTLIGGAVLLDLGQLANWIVKAMSGTGVGTVLSAVDRGRPTDAATSEAVLAVILILCAERLLHGRREQGGALLRRLRSKVMPVLGLILSALVLAASGMIHLVIALTMVGLLVAWGGLGGDGSSRSPWRLMIWLSPAVAGLAIVLAIFLAGRCSERPDVLSSRSVHWNAFWASPWLGYGLGEQTTVARLFMTRLNLEALTAFPTPATAYLVWLEQGGVLVAGPLLGCLAWFTGSVLFASLRASRLRGLMRSVVCSSLCLGVTGLISAAPSALSVEGLWIVLLGLGFGAAAGIH